MKKYVHGEEVTNSIWHLYYEGINPPSSIFTGEVQQVTATDNKCFAYICKFINLQDIAVQFEQTIDFSILLYETVTLRGPGTVHIQSIHSNTIIIDKFCSFESQSHSSEGQFTYFKGEINSTILQGSICNGGDNSVYCMIYQKKGFGSLSKTNISNCISRQNAGFEYVEVEPTLNISFCNFENLKAASRLITTFSFSPGRIYRCNYINNSQDEEYFGIVYVYDGRLDIFYSTFQNNPQFNKGKLFRTDGDGQIYIHQCNIDSYSSIGNVDTSERGESSFKNNLKFIDLSPCEGNFEIVLLVLPNKENKICSLSICKNFLFVKYLTPTLLISKR